MQTPRILLATSSHPAASSKWIVRKALCGFMTALLLIIAPGAGATELTIGLIPEQNVFAQMKRYEPIGKYIQGKTGIKIRFTILSRYGNILESFSAGKMDGAFWGSFTGALAIQQLNVEPIVRPVWLNGTSTYRGYIFTRKDSGIKTVSDMKGKSMAFVDKATTAGFIFPMALLREHGVTNVNTFFKEYYFAGSHDATVTAVLDKKVDIGCAKNTIFDRVAEQDPRVEDELVILAYSPDVPSNALGLRSDLDIRIKLKIKDALLTMNADPVGRQVLQEFGAIHFIPTSKENYAPVFHAAAKAGIDLKRYEYRNK